MYINLTVVIIKIYVLASVWVMIHCRVTLIDACVFVLSFIYPSFLQCPKKYVLCNICTCCVYKSFNGAYFQASIVVTPSLLTIPYPDNQIGSLGHRRWSNNCLPPLFLRIWYSKWLSTQSTIWHLHQCFSCYHHRTCLSDRLSHVTCPCDFNWCLCGRYIFPTPHFL